MDTGSLTVPTISGPWEVYLTTFPEGKSKGRVSANGEASPCGAEMEKEQFYNTVT